MINTQSKYKTLITIIVLLLITNVAVLAFFLSANKQKRGNKNKKHGFEVVLQKEVGFNNEQVTQFIALKDSFWAKAKNEMDEQKKVKQRLFNLTKNDVVSDSAINILADSIALYQKQIELNSFQHFKATRKICTEEQLPAYDSLMTKIITKMGRNGSKPPGKDKK
ncbi:MAG: Spy/CpxP family protein refolding chaperone [Niabella sp.]